LKYSVEVRQPLKLAKMRAQGLNPWHTPEAEVKRANATAKANRRRARNWTVEEYRARQAAASKANRERKRLREMNLLIEENAK